MTCVSVAHYRIDIFELEFVYRCLRFKLGTYFASLNLETT